ncbi:transposase [Corynebacterium belfantii]|uniref:IS3 family transposase n=1 Tax=Corynebacterium belfantii TaxID=2014537 RepID=UPI0018D2E7A3|nr:transposase [Corynebacterium belfantii]
MCISENYGVYGVRKMWHALQRQGIDIGREHTARLMRSAGLSGKGKGGAPVTTRQSKAWIFALTWSIVSLRPWPPIGCGWPTLPMCAPGKASCTQRS